MNRQIDRIPLDWDLFVNHYWDRCPVLIVPGDQAPFEAREVFQALTAATRPTASAPLRAPVNTQLTVDRVVREAAVDLLPHPADNSLTGYDHRLRNQLDGRGYALTVSTFHLFHHPQWARQRAFYSGLWERVGLPLNSAITTLFHGSYEHSPVGVHRDRFATFMYALNGHKRMRFWDRCPWADGTSTVLDYEPYLAESFSVEVAPGELLYWPSSYFHVGESNLHTQDDGTLTAATSVNIGVPRDFNRADFALMELLQDHSRETLLTGTPDVQRLPTLASPPLTPAPDALPPVLAEALETVREALEPARLAERTAALSLRRLTAGGFHPVPPPADETAALAPDTRLSLSEPVLWTEAGQRRVCGAAGHTHATPLTPEVLQQLLKALDTGPVSVAELLDRVPADDHAPVLGLLTALESFRVLLRH